MDRAFDAQPLVPLGFETLTVSTSSIGFASIPTRALFALVSVEGQPIRVSFGVTAPTATTGVPVPAWARIEVDSKLEMFRAIRDTTATAPSTLTVSYFGTRAE